jgi:hypothetical protein
MSPDPGRASPLLPSLVSNNYPLLLVAAISGDEVIPGWHRLVETQQDAGRVYRLFVNRFRASNPLILMQG